MQARYYHFINVCSEIHSRGTVSAAETETLTTEKKGKEEEGVTHFTASGVLRFDSQQDARDLSAGLGSASSWMYYFIVLK